MEASNYPLIIIMVGVGDGKRGEGERLTRNLTMTCAGPWDKMKEFDDDLPERKFDNVSLSRYQTLSFLLLCIASSLSHSLLLSFSPLSHTLSPVPVRGLQSGTEYVQIRRRVLRPPRFAGAAAAVQGPM